MILLYNALLLFMRAGIQLAALFSSKAKAFVSGRKNVFRELEQKLHPPHPRVVWIHCASLGEFEQGRPVIEAVKKEFPETFILLTFFSPSGYEIRKKYEQANHVCYLPWDTHQNAERFISIAKPMLAIFVKYEFWHHYSLALKSKNIPILSISSIFRAGQLFFKSYGTFYRNILKNFSYFFVQNEVSLQLLQSINLKNSVLAGDTRFDRVNQIVKQGEEIPIAKIFKGDQKVFVVGSCWSEDLEVLIPMINENKLKFILAPHELSESFLSEIEKSLEVSSIRYSQADGKNLVDYQVLIIDNIGMLSRLYRYGEFAFIGGAFGKGLHNILEAACYGVPIFFGDKNYEKFQEATDLINRGGAFEVHDFSDLKSKYEMLNTPESFLLACEVTRQYVEVNLGATEKIMTYIRKLFKTS
ncbi:MAG: glycosyltransferase N-terminal domain-containing protein [Chryseolinea sp.]